LQVRRWRDEEMIEALEAELSQSGRGRGGRRAKRRWLRTRWPRSAASKEAAVAASRQPVLSGAGPFFRRGFRVSEAATITGETVRRSKNAPSGSLVFGPYVTLAPGDYVAGVEVRLYQRQPLAASFRLEVVCGDARLMIASRGCRLLSLSGWRRFELAFQVRDGEAHPDFELRLWARQGAALEIREMELLRIVETASPSATGAAEAHHAAS